MTYLKFERIARGLTATEVAKEVNIPRTEYSKIENGRMKPWKPQAERIEKYFKIKIDVLIDTIPYPPALENGRILELKPGRNEKGKIKQLEGKGNE